MKMKKTLFLVALLGLFLLPLQGKAAISVIDFSNLKQNITTSLNMVKSVAQQITMISNQVKQYEAMLQSLKSFDSQTYNQLRILLQGNNEELDQLFREIDAIGYDIAQIDNQFDVLFPQGSDWNTIEFGRYGEYYQDWNKELSESAKNAMRTQSIVNRIQQYNNEMQEILSRSMGAEGEVRQLQANNQILGVVGSQLGDLTATLAANGRITATMAARAAADNDASLELKRRALEGYGGERKEFAPVRTGMP